MSGLFEKFHNHRDVIEKRKQLAAPYIRDLIAARREDFLVAFGLEDSDESDSRLFNKTSSLMSKLNAEHVRVAGADLRYLPLGEDSKDSPEAKLGWAEYVPALPATGVELGHSFPHVPLLTQEGIAVVDGFRTAQGLASLEQQRELNASRIEALVTAARWI